MESARCTSSTRLSQSALRRIALTCDFTVSIETLRISAISRVECPSPRSEHTAASASVRP